MYITHISLQISIKSFTNNTKYCNTNTFSNKVNIKNNTAASTYNMYKLTNIPAQKANYTYNIHIFITIHSIHIKNIIYMYI